MRTVKSNHSVTQIEYHIVFCPKYRHSILNPGIAAYLSRVIPKAVNRCSRCRLIESVVRPDHVHIIVSIPPTKPLCAVVGSIKQFCSSKLRNRFSYLATVYHKHPVVWARGYWSSSVGYDEAQILSYVRGNRY